MALRVPKVFGIGLQKTGTSTLHKAALILGYRSQKGIFINHPKGIQIAPPLSNEKVLPFALEIAKTHDAFSDNPWPLLFREMDAAFPGSKFILTVRDPDRWLNSVVRHFGERPEDVATWIYGAPYPRRHEKRYQERFIAHNAAVRGYFRNRQDDFLEWDIERAPSWEPLCEFLRLPIPACPFPHENPAQERERKRASAWRVLKSEIRRALSPGR